MSEIKWVLDGKVGATPTVTDLLAKAEEILRDADGMDFYLKGTDVRLDRIPNVMRLLKEAKPHPLQELNKQEQS